MITVMIRVCDKCMKPIDTEGPLGDQSWVQAAVSFDETVRDARHPKDYHRACARSIPLAEVWLSRGLIEL